MTAQELIAAQLKTFRETGMRLTDMELAAILLLKFRASGFKVLHLDPDARMTVAGSCEGPVETTWARDVWRAMWEVAP